MPKVKMPTWLAPSIATVMPEQNPQVVGGRISAAIRVARTTPEERHLHGVKMGHARAAALSAERRREIGVVAGKAARAARTDDEWRELSRKGAAAGNKARWTNAERRRVSALMKQLWASRKAAA